jgi:hypothetical protein
MAAGTDGLAMAPIDASATHAMPLIAAQGIDAIIQRVMDGDIQTVLIHDRHDAAKIISVVRPAFSDVELPLVDHLMRQCLEDFRLGLVQKKRNGKPNDTLIEKGTHGDWKGARPALRSEHAGGCGQPLAPDDVDKWQSRVKIPVVQAPPPGLELFRRDVYALPSCGPRRPATHHE